MVKSDDLIIPVYLNQRIVFDLVAMLQGGIAAVTQVYHTEKISETTSAEGSGTFGLSKALSSLFRIDFSGKAAIKADSDSKSALSEERIHTPASMFIYLRALLRDQGNLIRETEDMKPLPGNIIEFSAILKRNPLLETFDWMIESFALFKPFAEQKSKAKQEIEVQNMRKNMENFVSTLRSGNMQDLTATPILSGHRCVITLERQYLNDQSMSDLVDGTFKVVGKIIRVIEKDGGAIPLNRNTALGRLPEGTMIGLKEVFKKPNFDGYKMPELEWEIPGPVIQVLPIAIFA
jgi:hypothetical protein